MRIRCEKHLAQCGRFIASGWVIRKNVRKIEGEHDEMRWAREAVTGWRKE